MGIVEKELTGFHIDGEEVKVELNQTGEIHIHIGRSRLDLSKEEFKQFAEVVSNSGKKLQEIKDES